MINKEVNPKPIEAKSETIKSKDSAISYEKKILSSLKSGIFAFSIVLVINTFLKFLAITSNSVVSFELTSNDLIFSLWAFIIFSFIELAHRFKS